MKQPHPDDVEGWRKRVTEGYVDTLLNPLTDSLIAAEVVLADGRIIVADANDEEELFGVRPICRLWAPHFHGNVLAPRAGQRRHRGHEASDGDRRVARLRNHHTRIR